MDTYTLEAKNREVTGKAVKRLRESGEIPAVVYGKETEPKNVTLTLGVFDKLFTQAGATSIIDLVVNGGAPIKTLVQSLQRDPLYGTITHVDFKAVDMKKEVDVDVALVFEGESPAVKEQGGMLMRNRDTIAMRCLPTALISEFMIDLSVLKELGDSLFVRDMKAPEGITIIADPDEIIVSVSAPTVVEEKSEEEGAEAAPADTAGAEGAKEEPKKE